MADIKSERNEIKRFGGKPQPNSGRGAIKKGDAVLGPFMVDVKEYARSYAVSVSNWAKVSSDAIKCGFLSPAINIVLGEAGTGAERTRLWVIDDAMFNEMLEAWQEKYEEEE